MSTKALREWYPLEASPEVFTKVARQFGLPEAYTFLDILSLEQDYLATIAKPVHAVILLFPDTPEIVEHRRREDGYLPNGIGEKIVWIPQVDVGHACGTFALVHALGVTGLAPGLNDFFASCRAVPAKDRSKLFSSSPLIHQAHHSAITAGQSQPKDEDWEECDHFISFAYGDVDGQGHLLELDGTEARRGVLDRGVGNGDLLLDVARIVQEVYLPRAGDNIHFTMIALAQDTPS